MILANEGEVGCNEVLYNKTPEIFGRIHSRYNWSLEKGLIYLLSLLCIICIFAKNKKAPL